MNFRNLSIIFALLSLKVFANPINDVEISDVEVSTAEVSVDEFVTYSVEDSLLEDAEDSSTEVETPAISLPSSDLPCNDFNSCADYLKENMDLLLLLSIPEDLLQYMISQYDEEKFEMLQQKYNAIDYGTKVDVNGHTMSVNIMGENNEKTIVLLPARGIFSPIIYYNDFAKSLSTDFKVIIIEPFGYGLSDVVEEKRTNENIVSEVHACLEKLGVDQYYLMGHSIGGIYSLVYANKYPEEVLGFIGLDNTPNHFDSYDEVSTLPDNLSTIIKILYKYHMMSLLPEDIKDAIIVQLVEPDYLTYSEENMAILRTILEYSYLNPNIVDEVNNSYDNVISTNDIEFHCPLLLFVSSQTSELVPEWNSLHEAMILEPDQGELIPLDSTHIFIHAQHKDTIANKIKDFFN